MAYTKEYRAKNLKRIREANKKWNKDNIEKHRENNHEWYKNNKDITRERYLKRMYGITLKEYNQMFVDQNGLCMICGETEKNDRGLAVDHCHETGKVRGLLCQGCNSGIAFLKENISILENAIKYLKNK